MHIDFFLTDADYIVIDNKPVIRLFGKTEKGESVIVKDDLFKPYLYVIPIISVKEAKKTISDLELFDKNNVQVIIDSIEIVKKEVDGKSQEILKIFTQTPNDIQRLKDIIKGLDFITSIREFDIAFHKQYLFDNGFSPMTWFSVDGHILGEDSYADFVVIASNIKPKISKSIPKLKIMAFDIETMQTKEDIKEILMLSVATNTGLKKVFSHGKSTFEHSEPVKDEKAIIERFKECIITEKPDFIVGYNSDSFDFTIIKERADKYRIRLDIGMAGQLLTIQKRGMTSAAITKGFVHIDLYQFVFRIMRTTLKSETLTLDNVASELIGEKKLDVDFDKMYDDWKNKRDMKDSARYNLHDSVITLKLAEKILTNISALSKLTGLVPFDSSRSTYGQFVESFAMKKAAQLDVVIPNRPLSDEISNRMEQAPIEGAFVATPRAGLHKNIAVFDFRSLYPSIIVSHNIDPFTFNCSCCKGNPKNKVHGFSYSFCTKKHGFVPTIVEELVMGRYDIKKRMKSLDILSEEYSRLDMDQYAMKTVSNAFYGYLGFAGSRWYKRESAESVTAFGRDYIHKTIAIAENLGFDVLYGDTDSLFLRTDKNIDDILNTFLRDVNKILPGIMELEYEGHFKSGLFVSKKTGTGGAKKKYALLDDKGNMKIRGFEKVRRDWSHLARNTQEVVLQLVLSDKKDEAVSLVKKTILNLKGGKVDLESLIIFNQLTRAIEKYTQKGPHVSAAIRARVAGIDIVPGMVIPYIITKGSGSISSRAVYAPFAKNYDPDYYINKQIMPTTLRILEAVGVSEDELLGKSKQSGLFSFSKK
ncbi:MAG: DNA-directed DNA polymerase [DPANN group archaeon]|nr:DNA-directed DNA polymerase [DPANN group archaeon]